MVAIERLDHDGLRDLSQRIDDLGVLSVYVNADPRQDPNLQGVAIDLKTRFRELQRRVAEDAGSAQARDVAAALERFWPQMDGLASPTAAGRSRIAFAALGSDWILRLESAMPVAGRGYWMTARSFTRCSSCSMKAGRLASSWFPPRTPGCLSGDSGPWRR